MTEGEQFYYKLKYEEALDEIYRLSSYVTDRQEVIEAYQRYFARNEIRDRVMEKR